MRIIALLIITTLLQSCVSAGSDTAADTAFAYTIQSANVNSKTYPRVLISHVNFGKPSRKFLREYEQRVDGFVRQHLEADGFEVVSSGVFEDQWKNAIRRFGQPYNQTTGKLNEKAFQRVMRQVFSELQARNTVDAVIFTDLIEREVTYGTALNRTVRWDGVSRKLHTQGPGSGVPGDFNWHQPVEAVSLWVNVYTSNLEGVFQGAGGIEVTQGLSLKSTPKFIRRKNVLANKRTIEEGVALALHPMIKMEGYKGVTRPPVDTLEQ